MKTDSKKRPYVYLASESPRRKELLSMVGIDYETVSHGAEGLVPDDCSAEKAAEYLALEKARTADTLPFDLPILASDTVVVLDGKIFGKPRDRADAARMLKALSGRTHKVYTGVAINKPGHISSFTSETEVEFYELSDEEIEDYLDTGEYADKAGAYGIQGVGAVLVKQIRGDYYTVMGLPIAEVYRRLK
ncbi:MAG: septum formation inhibitor Maf [Lachnospiraceae bacterium]|nr:septum formation inhibitor Maf [Lachnospiraceae bacterium]